MLLSTILKSILFVLCSSTSSDSVVEFKNNLCIFLKNYSTWLRWQGSNLQWVSQSHLCYHYTTSQYLKSLLTYILHLALVDSNDLLYVTKRYNSHYVSPLGQRLEPFFNKLFSYSPLYFHLDFACSTVTIWVNYFYKGRLLSCGYAFLSKQTVFHSSKLFWWPIPDSNRC